MINNDLVSGYDLQGQISGTQEFGLRGGTENVAAIAGSIAAMKYAFTNRATKNAKLCTQREYILGKLRARFPTKTYRAYLAPVVADAPPSKAKEDKVSLIFLGPDCKTTKADSSATSLPRVLPNTILLSVVKADGSTPFCNVRLKGALEKNHVVISIGSACNTASPDASHVLDAIHAPDAIKRGVIRISFCDTTTKKELDAFIAAFTTAVNAQG